MILNKAAKNVPEPRQVRDLKYLQQSMFGYYEYQYFINQVFNANLTFKCQLTFRILRVNHKVLDSSKITYYMLNNNKRVPNSI